MPKCRNCHAPIIFLSERPDWVIVGPYNAPRQIRTEPRPVPIDVNPSPAGTIAIYEYPPRNSAYAVFRNWEGPRVRYIARLYGEALKMFIALGGAVYRSHMDTCRAPQRRG